MLENKHADELESAGGAVRPRKDVVTNRLAANVQARGEDQPGREGAIMGRATSAAAIRLALLRPRVDSRPRPVNRRATVDRRRTAAIIRASMDPPRTRWIASAWSTPRQLQNCKPSEEIIRNAVKKFGWRQDYTKNYCFYVVDGTEPDPARCRPISDAELVRICGDRSRVERHRGRAHRSEESSNARASAITKTMTRTPIKLELLTGEPWKNIQYPISPGSFASSQSHRSAEGERSMARPLLEACRRHNERKVG
ncbi:MAG: ATP binding [Phylliscum demangeonii]|nr:MAG: ATP binding [Phylliscum demangeonii]